MIGGMTRNVARPGLVLTLGICLIAGTGFAQSGDKPEPTKKPFLWMIDRDPPSFLFGTIHLPDDRVLALPDVVNEAFDASDVLYTEIPMDTETMQAATTELMLPAGVTLSDRLPADLYQRTDAYLKTKGFSIAIFGQLKPYALALQITLLDALSDLMTKQPLDGVLSSRAKEQGKEVAALETLDEQIGAFESLTDEEQVAMLDDTLDYLETFEKEGRKPLEELITLYVAGNSEDLCHAMYEYLDPENPVDQKLIRTLLTERNQHMADRIDERLRKEPDRVHFFAVGAMHYPLEDGILALLRQKNYTVKRIAAEDLDDLRSRVAKREGAAAGK